MKNLNKVMEFVTTNYNNAKEWFKELELTPKEVATLVIGLLVMVLGGIVFYFKYSGKEVPFLNDVIGDVKEPNNENNADYKSFNDYL